MNRVHLSHSTSRSTARSRATRRALALSILLSTAPAIGFAQNEVPATPAAVEATAPRKIDPAQTVMLWDALKAENWDAATAALQGGADLNFADKTGMTPLMRAAGAHKTDLVALLLQNGAQANALDKKGLSALQYALPQGMVQPKKKKKFGLGSLGKIAGGVVGSKVGGVGNLGKLGDLANNPIAASLLGDSSLDALLGTNLQGLLGSKAFDLAGKNNWTAIAGAALQGDTGGKLGVASLLGGKLTGATGLDAGGWTSLLSSVQKGKPEILGAMMRLGDAKNADLWSGFLNAAGSGDAATVAQLMKNPSLEPLLQQATGGLYAAAGELPGNATRSVITALLQNGANPSLKNRAGQDALALAQARGLDDLAALLGDR